EAVTSAPTAPSTPRRSTAARRRGSRNTTAWWRPWAASSRVWSACGHGGDSERGRDRPAQRPPLTGRLCRMDLHVEVAGEGAPVVLVHAGICDSGMWDPQWDS